MVCKKEKVEGSVKMIIYLREVVTGHQENVIMWVDDQIFSALDPEIASKSQQDPAMDKHKQLIKFVYNLQYQFNTTFIFKSGLTTASSYL